MCAGGEDVITPETIEAVYGIPVAIERFRGRPVVVPVEEQDSGQTGMGHQVMGMWEDSTIASSQNVPQTLQHTATVRQGLGSPAARR